MEDNILCKIHHFPLIITKIFEYSLKRPFILHFLFEKSKYLKERAEKFKIEKFNILSKQINNLYSLFYEIQNLSNHYNIIMTKKLKIEDEEKKYYITKPNINILYDASENLIDKYKMFFQYNHNINIIKNFESLFEFCSIQPFIFLSINLFSKDNDINKINLDLTEADLDINYIKYINMNNFVNAIKNQKMKLVINIYNRYNKSKLKNFYMNNYFTNIDLIKNLKIEELYFIRPSLDENEKLENIFFKTEIIEEIELMFKLINDLKNKDDILFINFSDTIIKTISLYYNDIIKKEVIKTSFNNNFKNLKNININSNLVNKNIMNLMKKIFKFNLSIIHYEDIINFNFDKNKKIEETLTINDGILNINFGNNIIYNKYLYKYLSNMFSFNNSYLAKKVYKIEIIYNYEDNEQFINSDYNIEFEKGIDKCYLSNLKEIIIKNTSNKVNKKAIINHNQLFNFFSFIYSASNTLSIINIHDTFTPFNISDIFRNKNIINNIIQLSIISPSLNRYNYSEIIEKINKCENLQYILIDTLFSNFNDSFYDIKISKNLKNIKEFKFNDFFEYKNIDKNKIIFKQNCLIDNELFEIFSEIVENENQLQKIELNGFHYKLDNIKNKNITSLEINLEENDRDYKINKIKFKDINLRLNNFPNLASLYIYVDIVQKVDNFILHPISPKLKRIFLFSSYIICDINQLDKYLQRNGVELIVRNIDNFNKSKILAYITSFPNI